MNGADDPGRTAPIQRLWGDDVLGEREELLREAEQIAHVGSWGWDMQSGRVFWSHELYRILGFDPERQEATFEAFMAAIHPDDRMSIQELAMRAASGDVAERAEYRVVRPNGELRWVTGVAQVFKTDEGVPVRMVGVALDVTERKQLEEQLQHAQKMEALGRMAGGVAHDFNNLLTIIMLNVEHLRTHATSHVEHLENVSAAAAQAAALTSQLLAFSRHSVQHVTALDLNAVVAAALSLVGHVLGEGIETRSIAHDGPLVVRADESQLHQVLLNLALNARDAMDGKGELVVRTEIVDARRHAGAVGRYAHLSVSDVGKGMDERTRVQIFEPFFTTKPPGKGTGLGLATVFGIVSQSNGFIEVDSTPGSGSTFHVYLPISEAALTAVSVIPASMARGSEMLLLVEDDPSVRAIVAGVLEDAGYQVKTAASPSEALAIWAAEQERIALLVSDVVMPEMNGPQLLARLRETRPGLPAVLMTGYVPDEHAAGAEPSAWLTKPFLAADLLTTVRDALATQRRTATVASRV